MTPAQFVDEIGVPTLREFRDERKSRRRAYVQDRTAMVGGREAQHANLRDVERELNELELRSRVSGVASDAAHIEATIEGLFAKPVTLGDRVRGTVASVTARCTRLDVRTAEDCHRISQLRAELAAAAEESRRADRLIQLRKLVREMRERGADNPADSVAELFAWLSRGLLSVRNVGFGFPIGFALLIELVSSFGPIGISTYAAATRGAASGVAMATLASLASPPLGMAQIEHRTEGSLVDFIAEETVPASETTAIGGDELHRSYVRWCRQKGREALGEKSFEVEFDRLRGLPEPRGKIRKFGTRYFGIALARGAEKSLSHGGS
jgi:hypothetical protein